MKVEELIQMAASVLEVSREEWFKLWEAQKDDAEMNRRMKEDWEAAPRDSDDAVIDYYRTSKMWFVNTVSSGLKSILALANHDPGIIPSQDWHIVFKNYIAKGNTILDYGGGFWKDTALLAMDGYPVVQAEIEGPVTRMLEMVKAASPAKQFLKILPVNSSRPLKEVYHGVACFELLEHLLNPFDFLKYLQAHMTGASPIALSVSFGAPEHAPYHIAQNEPLGRGDTWWRMMEDAGFTKIWRASDCEKWVWRKK